jgi:hypothetical protein
VTCPDGISTGLRLASLSLPYTHLCIFMCVFLVYFSRDFGILCTFLLMIFIESSIILLSFVLLEYWNIC